MATWAPDELDRLERAEEVELSSARADGSARSPVTLWVVRIGDQVYTRSAYGPANGWFRKALAGGRGFIRAEGVHREVTFERAGADVLDAVAAAFRRKYERFGPLIVGSVPGLGAHRTAILLRPR